MTGTALAALEAALIVVGVFFLTVGTIGLLRLPNVYNRMHATSKPTTLGAAAIFLAAYVRFGPGNEGLTALVGMAFLFLTVPTGAHMIARSAQRIGVPFLGSVTWPVAGETWAVSDEDDPPDPAESPDPGAGVPDPDADRTRGSEAGSEPDE